MHIDMDLDAVDATFVEMLAGEFATYRKMAETREPKVAEAAEKVAQAEAALKQAEAEVKRAADELKVQREEHRARNADFEWAANRTRSWGSLITGICKAKNWGLPAIPADPPMKNTSDFPAVPVPPAATSVFPQVASRSQAPSAKPPEWANGPEAEGKLDDFLKGDAELDEADDPDKDDDDPPSGDATGDAAKPRPASTLRERLGQTMSALFVWPMGHGRHVGAVRAT